MRAQLSTNMTTLGRAVLAELYKAGQMMTIDELREAVDVPDVDAAIDVLRRYVQRVWVPGTHSHDPNGVALTLAGLDLAQAEWAETLAVEAVA